MTSEQANETAKSLAADPFAEMFGGAIVIRALDGSGYDAAWGNPEMTDDITIYTKCHHKPAEIVVFYPYAL